MRSILVCLFLYFITQYAQGIPAPYRDLIHLDEAINLYEREGENFLTTENPRLAIQDVSFFGHRILLKNQLDLLEEVPPLSLLSPHGVAVAQVITDKEYGVKTDQKISLLTRGIYEEDIQRAVEKWIEHRIDVVNLSIRLRTPEIVASINTYIDQGGIAIISAGNDGERFGPDLPAYYKDFKGLIVGACDDKGLMTSFSQYGLGTILAPGELESIPVERLVWKMAPRNEPQDLDTGLTIRSYLFGQTSASTPIVTAVVLMAKKINPALTQKEVNEMIHETSFVKEGKPVLNAYKFLKKVRESSLH
jgi:hypothetical protein